MNWTPFQLTTPFPKRLFIGMVLTCLAVSTAQPPVSTHLKKILVLDKCQGGANAFKESRRDFNAALVQLAADKGFEFTLIGQDDSASKVKREFSAEALAGYQAVIFGYNDGVDQQLDSLSKENLEAYVKNGGGLIAIYAASAFIANWPWLTSALVQSFYGPHGNNQPKVDISQDPEGMQAGTETKGIFQGLSAPSAFLDRYFSFQASPRDTLGVTILLTIDENSSSMPINSPMGDDHPVAWVKAEGKGHVVTNSLGYSWATNNVYTADDSYLTKFMYGLLRYVAGDFIGCTDKGFQEFNPDATKSDPTACLTPATSIVDGPGKKMPSWITEEASKRALAVAIPTEGVHSVTLLDISGRTVLLKQGLGPVRYVLPIPAKSGIYLIRVQSAGKTQSSRFFAL